MKTATRITTIMASLVVGAAFMGTVGAADAAAIDRVSDCANRTDLFVTYSTTGNTCWANNGYTSVTLYKVSQVSAGKNRGLYVANSTSYSFTTYAKHDLNYPTVTYIEITGR